MYQFVPIENKTGQCREPAVQVDCALLTQELFECLHMLRSSIAEVG